MEQFQGTIGQEHFGLICFHPKGQSDGTIFARVEKLTDGQKVTLHQNIGKECTFNYHKGGMVPRIVEINGEITILA